MHRVVAAALHFEVVILRGGHRRGHGPVAFALGHVAPYSNPDEADRSTGFNDRVQRSHKPAIMKLPIPHVFRAPGITLREYRFRRVVDSGSTVAGHPREGSSRATETLLPEFGSCSYVCARRCPVCVAGVGGLHECRLCHRVCAGRRPRGWSDTAVRDGLPLLLCRPVVLRRRLGP